jgi:glucosamine kinase
MATSRNHSAAPAAYLLGIDGGGTACRARLTDASGRVLGEGSAGPANLLTIGLDAAVQAVMDAARSAYCAASLGDEAMSATHAAFGIAGAGVMKHPQSLAHLRLPFRSVTIRSDAEIACLGAHGERDGGILILGTGSQGLMAVDDCISTVGGWGFTISDHGSGAQLGRAAVRRSLLAHDGLAAPSPFTAAIMARFNNDPKDLFEWAANALPRDWAGLAPAVFEHAGRGDAVALELVREGVADVVRLLERLIELGAAKISIMGGLARPYRPYLPERFLSFLMEPRGDALDGALLLARRAAAGASLAD